MTAVIIFHPCSDRERGKKVTEKKIALPPDFMSLAYSADRDIETAVKHSYDVDMTTNTSSTGLFFLGIASMSQKKRLSG